MTQFFGLLIPFVNFIIWCLQWHLIVGFNALRHEILLWFPMSIFITLSTLQAIMCRDAMNSQSQSQRDRETLETPVSIAASILVAISIIASVPILPKELPLFKQGRIYCSALTAFLWIVLGVFAINWLESNNVRRNEILSRILRTVKVAVLLEALGWAATAAILLMYILKA